MLISYALMRILQSGETVRKRAEYFYTGYFPQGFEMLPRKTGNQSVTNATRLRQKGLSSLTRVRIEIKCRWKRCLALHRDINSLQTRSILLPVTFQYMQSSSSAALATVTVRRCTVPQRETSDDAYLMSGSIPRFLNACRLEQLIIMLDTREINV